MGLHQSVVFTCDMCESHFTVGNDMELPPGWIGVQMAVADADGYIPTHERDIYIHFCSLQCLGEYMSGDDMKERYYLADRTDNSMSDDEEDD